MGSALQLASLVLTVSNINWKGINMTINAVRGWAKKISWGKVVPAIVVLILLLVAVWDWRKAHTDLVEANATIVAVTAERNTLLLKVTADDAARTERDRILEELGKAQVVALDEVKTAVEASGDTARQPLPKELRDALRR